MAKLTRASKIDNFNRRPLRITQENVLWLEVAVYNTQFGRGEEKQSGAQLLGKLASQIERNAAKVGVAQ